MQNLWRVESDHVKQALTIAYQTKNLAHAVKERDGLKKWGEKWEQESDELIASFEYFLAGDVHPAYRFATWINLPQHHLAEIRQTMLLFGIDVDTLNVHVEAIEPVKVNYSVVEVRQEALF
jgi:hypothetical protein